MLLALTTRDASDDYTTWAKRKRWLEAGQSSVSYEMRVVDLILSKQPKSGGAWEQRRFLANKVLKQASGEQGVESFIRQEVDVCERLCTRHMRNYFAWSYRAWLCEHRSSEALKEEVTRLKEWVSTHVSDGSALHHLLCVTKLLMDRSARYVMDLGSRIRLLVSNLEWCSKLSTMYPGHESLWKYRRELMAMLLQLLEERCAGVSGYDCQQAMLSVDLFPKTPESSRYQSYQWWMEFNEMDLPSLDSVLQVVFDELDYLYRYGLFEPCGETGDEWDELKRDWSVKNMMRDRKLALSALAFVTSKAKRVSIVQKALEHMKDSSKPVPIAPGCLSTVDLKSFINAFPQVDAMDFADFKRSFTSIFAAFEESDLQKLFEAFDSDGSGMLSRNEFLSGAVVLCGGKRRSKIRCSFDILDVNKNGSLDRDELSR